MLQYCHTYLRQRADSPSWLSPDGEPGAAGLDLLSYVRSTGLPLVAYSPLLSGAYVRPDKPLGPEFSHAGTPRRLAALSAVASETGATANQVVLAWLVGGELAVIPLVGASRWRNSRRAWARWILRSRLSSGSGWIRRAEPALPGGAGLGTAPDSQLITRETDPFRKGRSLYRITEPLIIFYEAVMRREWTRLERGDTAGAWHNSQVTFLTQVVGPHFEAVCRDWALSSGAQVFGTVPGDVAAGVVPDPLRRSQIQVDAAVLRPTSQDARAACCLSVKPSGTRS